MNKFILEIIKQHIAKMFTLIKQKQILDIFKMYLFRQDRL